MAECPYGYISSSLEIEVEIMGQLPDTSALIPEEETTVNRQQEAGCCTE
jgi:hypothetical protein